MLPAFGCCEYCCCEHAYTNISLRPWFKFFWVIYPEAEFLDRMVILFLIFLRNCYTVSHNDCINLHLYQQRMRVSLSPFPHQYLFLLVLLMFSSVTQSCLALCNPMDCSMPGFPVHHQLTELAQTHVHRVGDAIQPSHPVISFSCLQFFQHHGLFQ